MRAEELKQHRNTNEDSLFPFNSMLACIFATRRFKVGSSRLFGSIHLYNGIQNYKFSYKDKALMSG